MNEPVAPTIRWTTTISGRLGHSVFVDARNARVLVSDGWGVSFGALCLRALSCADGSTLATTRLGNAVRALSTEEDGSILAATDTKLFKLNGKTLAETARWTARVPRYTDELLVAGGFAHLSNRSRPTLHALDLHTGAVKRKEVGAFASLFKLDESRLLVASGVGRVAIVHVGIPRAPEVLASTPAFCDAALDARGRAWLSLGMAREESGTTVRPGQPTSMLAWLDIANPSALQQVDLGLPFWQCAISRDGTRLCIIALTVASEGPPRRTDVATFRTEDFKLLAWQRVPQGYEVQEVSPEMGLGWATRGTADTAAEPRSELMCFTLER